MGEGDLPIKPDSIEVFLKREFNYTEEQIADFKEWQEKNKDYVNSMMPLGRSWFLEWYVGHQVDRAKRRS